MDATTKDRLAEIASLLVDADQSIHNLPPTYPAVGHQYCCGFLDGKYAAAAIVRKVGMAIAMMQDGKL